MTNKFSITLNISVGDTIRVTHAGVPQGGASFKVGGITHSISQGSSSTHTHRLGDSYKFRAWGLTSTNGAVFTINGVTNLKISHNNLPDTKYEKYNRNEGTFYVNTVISPNQPPTYLETLDKLDQWSSAQYTPNSRNILNL